MIKQISKMMRNVGHRLDHKGSVPTKSEYSLNYPERILENAIACSCGSINLKPFSAPVNVGPIFHKCVGCDVVLFTTDIKDNCLVQEKDMKHIKLAVFDMEGTLFRNMYRGEKFKSIWKTLCAQCGPQAIAEDAVNTDRYYAGGYPGYSAWVLDTLRLLKKYGLKRVQFETIIKEINYYPGVAETFAALRSKGMKIAVISGGLKALADRVAVDHYVGYCFSAAEFYWNQDGTIRHWNMQPTDFAHKRSVLEILCRDLGVSGDECLFVGDGRNDREVAGFCALSIGFNPHDELRKEVDIIIEQPEGQENLAAILEPVSKYPNFKLDDFSEHKVWKENQAKDLDISSLTTSSLRNAFHTFLLKAGLTDNSANSYCSYINNLCKNVAEDSWEGASGVNAFTVLARGAKSIPSEAAFIAALIQPLAGTNGRQNDTLSAAKQFYRFVMGGENG